MKMFLLSFFSPFGRLAPLAFWWRCFVIASLLFPCMYALTYYGAITHRGVGNNGMADLLVFTQLTLPTLVSAILGYFGGDEVGASAVHLNVEGLKLCGGFELPLAILIGLLLTWSQAVIALKRVRDTRWGTPLLLASLPCFGPLSVIVYCLPSRPKPLPPLSEQKFRKLTAADFYTGSTEKSGHRKPQATN